MQAEGLYLQTPGLPGRVMEEDADKNRSNKFTIIVIFTRTGQHCYLYHLHPGHLGYLYPSHLGHVYPNHLYPGHLGHVKGEAGNVYVGRAGHEGGLYPGTLLPHRCMVMVTDKGVVFPAES